MVHKNREKSARNRVLWACRYRVCVLYVFDDQKITLEGFTGTGEAKYEVVC